MHPTDNTRTTIVLSEPAHNEPSHPTCQALVRSGAGGSRPVVRARFNSCQVQHSVAQPGVLLFTDTPNVFKECKRHFGCEFIPDYEEILATAASRGSLVSAYALVNDGYPVDGNIFVICGGDHRYARVTSLLRAAGKYVIVAFYRGSCSRELIREANEYICFPVKPRVTPLPDVKLSESVGR